MRSCQTPVATQRFDMDGWRKVHGKSQRAAASANNNTDVERKENGGCVMRFQEKANARKENFKTDENDSATGPSRRFLRSRAGVVCNVTRRWRARSEPRPRESRQTRRNMKMTKPTRTFIRWPTYNIIRRRTDETRHNNNIHNTGSGTLYARGASNSDICTCFNNVGCRQFVIRRGGGVRLIYENNQLPNVVHDKYWVFLTLT